MRVADFEVRPSVSAYQWRRPVASTADQLLADDIFVLGEPIWLGTPSSVRKRVTERLSRHAGRDR